MKLLSTIGRWLSTLPRCLKKSLSNIINDVDFISWVAIVFLVMLVAVLGFSLRRSTIITQKDSFKPTEITIQKNSLLDICVFTYPIDVEHLWSKTIVKFDPVNDVLKFTKAYKDTDDSTWKCGIQVRANKVGTTRIKAYAIDLDDNVFRRFERTVRVIE